MDNGNNHAPPHALDCYAMLHNDSVSHSIPLTSQQQLFKRELTTTYPINPMERLTNNNLTVSRDNTEISYFNNNQEIFGDDQDGHEVRK